MLQGWLWDTETAWVCFAWAPSAAHGVGGGAPAAPLVTVTMETPSMLRWDLATGPVLVPQSLGQGPGLAPC